MLIMPPELVRVWGVIGILTAFLLLGFLTGVIYERTNESIRTAGDFSTRSIRQTDSPFLGVESNPNIA